MAGSKEYLGVRGTQELTRLVKTALAGKQDNVTGKPNDILMFDEAGNLVASGELQALYDEIKNI